MKPGRDTAVTELIDQPSNINTELLTPPSMTLSESEVNNIQHDLRKSNLQNMLKYEIIIRRQNIFVK